MSAALIRSKVRASIDALRKQAVAAARDAERLARGAAETEADLENGRRNTLARLGFITYDEAASMLSANARRPRRSSR
jgi:hypothetical protein